jgi:Domain of unknown function (DUF5086)
MGITPDDWRVAQPHDMRLPGLAAIVAATITAAFSTALIAGSAIDFTLGSTWKLPSTPTDLRWLEIHSVERVGTETLYHISVLSRQKVDPVWSSKHVVAHMAITETALNRSISPQPSRMGAAYPETYEEAYRSWLAMREKGNAPICETSVMECAHL